MRAPPVASVIAIFTFIAGCALIGDDAKDWGGMPEMKGRQLTLGLGDSEITLFVDSPVGVDPIDDYREVNFELPGKGRHRAVFFLLPDKNSGNPYATMPISNWDVPVRWDDNTMLFVPTLADESILAAIKYILTNGLEGEAFEDENDIRLSDGSSGAT